MVKKPEEPKSQFYVSVDNPSELHRAVLLASRETLLILKNLERIKHIRDQKNQTITKFNAEVTALRAQVNRLIKELPKYHQQKETHSKKPTKVTLPKIEAPKPITEIDKLESELSAIEQKLSSL
jgi:predicted  nucleic acid-binding Zn-ribbon protein